MWLLLIHLKKMIEYNLRIEWSYLLSAVWSRCSVNVPVEGLLVFGSLPNFTLLWYSWTDLPVQQALWVLWHHPPLSSATTNHVSSFQTVELNSRRCCVCSCVSFPLPLQVSVGWTSCQDLQCTNTHPHRPGRNYQQRVSLPSFPLNLYEV